MEKKEAQKIAEERINDNRKLFTNEELIFLNDYANIIKKIYFIGVNDGLKTLLGGQKSGQK